MYVPFGISFHPPSLEDDDDEELEAPVDPLNDPPAAPPLTDSKEDEDPED